MPLAAGRHYLAIPGPSVVPDRVLQAMHRAAPNIYSGDIVDMVDGMIPALKSLVRTRHNAAIYITNGHGMWEGAVANTLNRGDKVLILATGAFAHGWAEMAQRMGVDTQVMDFGKRCPIEMDKVAQALRDDTQYQIKAVMTVHVDTATSVRNDIPALRATLDSADHPALLMVDCIASLACDDFRMDDWGVDLVVAACQKGLMTPPGLGFVFFNDKASAARDACTEVSHYWDWRPRVNPEEFYLYFDGTAPTHHLYGLREALTMIAEEGYENTLHRHGVLARAYWAVLDAWSTGGPVELNVADPNHRSHAVTTVRIGSPHGTALRDWLSENAGVTLGIGLGMAPAGDPAWHGFFRLGHMGHVNAHMVLGTVGAMQAGMGALGIPFGPGALDAAAEVCAKG